jgi:hypothetical protein
MWWEEKMHKNLVGKPHANELLQRWREKGNIKMEHKRIYAGVDAIRMTWNRFQSWTLILTVLNLQVVVS